MTTVVPGALRRPERFRPCPYAAIPTPPRDYQSARDTETRHQYRHPRHTADTPELGNEELERECATVILLAGGASLIAGVIALLVPVSITGDGKSIGCGNAVAADLVEAPRPRTAKTWRTCRS